MIPDTGPVTIPDYHRHLDEAPRVPLFERTVTVTGAHLALYAGAFLAVFATALLGVLR